MARTLDIADVFVLVVLGTDPDDISPYIEVDSASERVEVDSGDEFAIGFSYIVGRPPMTEAFTSAFTPPGAIGQPSAVNISPPAPNQTKTVQGQQVAVGPREVQSGTLTGAAPLNATADDVEIPGSIASEWTSSP